MGEANTLPLDQLLSSRGHTANLQGRPYVLLSGLLEVAHNYGLESITTEPIDIDMTGRSAVFRCVVTGERGTFTGHGDSTPRNTGKMVASAFIRMAETRAVCRALRFYLGIGMTARDELPGDADQSAPILVEVPQPPPAPRGSWPAASEIAEHCDVSVAQLERFFGSVPASRDFTEAGAWLGEKIASDGLLRDAVLAGALLKDIRLRLHQLAAEALKTLSRDEVETKLQHVGRIDDCQCVIQLCHAYDSLQSVTDITV